MAGLLNRGDLPTFADGTELNIEDFCPGSVATNGQLLAALPDAFIVGVCGANLQAMGFALFDRLEKRLLQHDTDIFANYGDVDDGGKLIVCAFGNTVVLASTRDCSLQLATVADSRLRVDPDSRHDVSGQDDFSDVTISAMELKEEANGSRVLRVTAQNESELIVETFDFTHGDLEHVLRKTVKERSEVAGTAVARPSLPLGGEEEISDEASEKLTYKSESSDSEGAQLGGSHRPTLAEPESSDEDEPPPPPKLATSDRPSVPFGLQTRAKWESAPRPNGVMQSLNPLSECLKNLSQSREVADSQPVAPPSWLLQTSSANNGGVGVKSSFLKSTPPKLTEPLAAQPKTHVPQEKESAKKALPPRPPAVPAACGELIALMEARIDQLYGRLRQVREVDLDSLLLKPSEEWLEIDKRIRDSKRVFEVEAQLCDVTDIERSLDEAKDALAADLVLWDTLVNSNRAGTPADTLVVINGINQAMSRSTVPAWESTWANSRRLVEGVVDIVQKQDS